MILQRVITSWVRVSAQRCITPSLVPSLSPLSALRFNSSDSLPPSHSSPTTGLLPEPASEGDLAQLTLNGWSNSENSKGDRFITKELWFRNFSEAWAFMNMIALKASQMNHHPKLTNLSSNVRISLHTFDAGNTITLKDIQLARYIDYAAKTFVIENRKRVMIPAEGIWKGLS